MTNNKDDIARCNIHVRKNANKNIITVDFRPTDKRKCATHFDKQDRCIRLVFQNICSKVTISLFFAEAKSS